MAERPKPIVPPSRIRPYFSFSPASMYRVALSARGEIGAKKILRMIPRAKIAPNARRKGNAAMAMIPISMVTLMPSRWRRVESARPVHSGAPIRVISGVMPVSRPICVPLKSRD